MAQFAHCDVSRWPVVTITLAEHPRDDQDFKTYLSLFDILYAKKEKICVIIDARNVGWVSPSYIFKQAAHMMNKEAQTKAYVHRIALLITTPIAKMLLNLLYSIRTPARPTEIFQDLESAWLWVWHEYTPLQITNNQPHQMITQNTSRNV